MSYTKEEFEWFLGVAVALVTAYYYIDWRIWKWKYDHDPEFRKGRYD